MIEIPSQLNDEQNGFVLIKTRQKVPFEKEWQRNPHSIHSARLRAHLVSDGNYGVVCGINGNIVVDYDDENIQNKTIDKLPETFTVRSGGGLKHLYFKSNKTESFKILDSAKNTLVDIQGTGKQIVAPGSTHPNGNKYTVVRDLPIAFIDIAELKAVFEPWLDEKHKSKKVVVSNKNHLVQEIKSHISVPSLLADLCIDINKNPTECPLHSSKHGKCLSYKEDVWHCFHCEEGGDVLNLFMLYNKCDFKQAVKVLSERAGIQHEPKEEETNPGYRLAEAFGKSIDFLSVAESFIEVQPLLYDINNYWWIWNFDRYCWEMVDETGIMVELDNVAQDDRTINLTNKAQIIESLKREARRKYLDIITRQDEKTLKNLIQFKSKIFNIQTDEEFDATPEFFLTNPLPWDIGVSEETPIIDSYFEQWVGSNEKQILYEIMAYCMLPNYPLHKIFCLIGSGRNGKGTYLRLVKNFLGLHNCTSSSLDVIMNSLFEASKLFKKLACFMGETNFKTMSRTEMLKALSGQDLITAQFKHKNSFDFENYARLLIATNSLPVTADKTVGFYSRWIIIEFLNRFEDTGKSILDVIPQEEYQNLAKKCLRILKELLGSGKFYNEACIEDRAKLYEDKSNPLNLFILEKCTKEINAQIEFRVFYEQYSAWCLDNGYRIENLQSVGHKLTNEGFEKHRKSYKNKDGSEGKTLYYFGLKLKDSKSGHEGHDRPTGNLSDYTHKDITEIESTSSPSCLEEEGMIVEEEYVFTPSELKTKVKELLKDGEKKEEDLLNELRDSQFNCGVSDMLNILDSLARVGDAYEIPRGTWRLI